MFLVGYRKRSVAWNGLLLATPPINYLQSSRLTIYFVSNAFQEHHLVALVTKAAGLFNPLMPGGNKKVTHT